MELSFILPIYNVEEYLPACVESIRSQMDEGCEIILVDDGSPDGSGTLCDRYAAEDPRIRVVHKENGGLSSARNAGMDAAEGDYLCFVDSDDYIMPDTVSRLLQWIRREPADICFLKTKRIYPDGSENILGEELQRQALRGQDRAEALHHLATRPIYPGSAWAKLFKRQFLEDRGFRFPADRRLSEDLLFCLEAYFAAESFDYLDFPFYCYRQARPGSITSDISPRYYFDSFLFTEEVARRFAEERTSPEGELALAAGAYEYAIRIWEAGKLPAEVQTRAWEKLRTYRWVLDCGKCRKVQFVRTAVKLLGLRSTAMLMGFYQRHRN